MGLSDKMKYMDYQPTNPGDPLNKLIKSNLLPDPIKQFSKWFDEVVANKEKEPSVMFLSTIGKDGFPEARVVLLKDVNKNGFVFYTNYFSTKSESIFFNNKVSLAFFWQGLQRQVRITGIAKKNSGKISDAYFKSRPYLSNVGAWASHQSKELSSKTELETKFRYYLDKFVDKEIPRPNYWGGFIVKPIKFEFWQGGKNRLHDRFIYTRKNKRWAIKQLYP